MIRRMSFAAVLCVLLSTGTVSAALLPPITVAGTAWLQPRDFDFTTWADISAVCDPVTGACNGSLGGNDLNGWTWANLGDVNALFNHYIGSPVLSPDSMATHTGAGADWLAPMRADGFLETFIWPGDTHLPVIYNLGGFHRGSLDDGTVYRRYISTSVQPFPVGSVASTVGTLASADVNASYFDYGAWFVRGDTSTLAVVPVTDTLPLVGLGLCALGFAGRNRKLAGFSTPHHK